MNRILLLLLLIVWKANAEAQSAVPSYISTNTYLNNYVQPAPNAASLGKYADYPVSYYTGVPEISIPLYTLKDGAAQMPISISYHSSGIKVSETASWVGLGWALNAGGVIIRTVRGAPDEGSGYGLSGYAGPTGYYKDSGLKTLPLLPYPGASGSFKGLNTYSPQAIMAGYMDTEPDLFTFNFNGKTGKFVFDENRTPRLLTDDNLIITTTYDGTSFISWVITDENGVQYYFGENNAYELSLPSSYLNNGYVDPRSNHPSNWYLTRVVYPNTKDTIYLNYTPEKYLYRDLAPESTTYDALTVQNACINFIVAQDVLQTTVNGVRLTSIKSKNYNIVLAAHTQRQDLFSVSTPLAYSLDSINIYTTQGLCLKQYMLGHSYFTSTTGSTSPLIGNRLSLLKDATDTKRLKLVSLTEYSGDGTLAKPPYNFTYFESIQLPRRLSYDQDHWGYANNWQGSNNSFFTPPVVHPICTVNPGIGANRNPRWPDMQAYTLSSMIDPLGAVTNFIFEAHAADIGGLRIQKITVTDSLTGSVKVRTFTYNGLALYNKPQYLIVPNNEFYLVSNQGAASYQGYSYNNKLVVRNIIKQSQSVVPLQDVQGNHVGYSNVRETFGVRGEGGSVYYSYQTNGEGNESSRLDMYNYANYGTYYINGIPVSVLTGNGLFNGILPQNLNYHSGYSGVPYYPITPNQVSYGRGRLGATLTYDSAGNLIHSVYSGFAATFHENYNIRGLKAFRTPILNLSALDGSNASGAYWDAFSFYKLHTGIAHLISNSATDYKDGKAMTTYTTYTYESPNHTLKTGETTVNSTGDTIIKKTYYSFDYAATATPDTIFGKMKARNLLVPVSTRVWKNNTLIGGTVTQFKDFAGASTDTFINPVKIYNLETTVPLTVAQAGETIPLTGQFTSLLPDTNFIEKADFNFNGTFGRLIEQKLFNNKNQVLIWDNQFQLPLAQVDNASFSDVAYCSFETAESGNWTFTNSAIVIDTTAPTGIKAYTIGASTPISASGLTSAQSYIISYWSKTGASITVSGGTQSSSLTGNTLNGWIYHELKTTGTTSLSITGTGNIDEIRLYPAMGQMTTYAYDANLRMISTCSVNSTISHYEYDALHRLTDIKDQNGNVIKAFEYNYGRQSR